MDPSVLGSPDEQPGRPGGTAAARATAAAEAAANAVDADGKVRPTPAWRSHGCLGNRLPVSAVGVSFALFVVFCEFPSPQSRAVACVLPAPSPPPFTSLSSHGANCRVLYACGAGHVSAQLKRPPVLRNPGHEHRGRDAGAAGPGAGPAGQGRGASGRFHLPSPSLTLACSPAHMLTHVHTHAHTLHAHTHTTCTHTHTHVQAYTLTPTLTYTYKHTHSHAHINVHTRTYTHTHSHARTRILASAHPAFPRVM